MKLEEFKQRIKHCNTFFIIGAEKANYTDDFYLQSDNIRYCVLIEPLPFNISVLEEKFNDNDAFNIIPCAITPKCGLYEMITTQNPDDNLSGSSSLILNERNNIRKDLEKKNDKPQIIQIEGRTIHSIKEELDTLFFDYIQIDTEGNDRDVFFQLVENGIQFKNIMIESMWLKSDEKQQIHSKLSELGYTYFDDGCNTIAFKDIDEDSTNDTI
jgi:FkbM family methyltransferase